MIRVIVDYDGTITDRNTFDALARSKMDPEEWRLMEQALDMAELPLRDSLARKASFVRMSLVQADLYLQERVRFDPTFPEFVRLCTKLAIPVSVVSAGPAPLIRAALKRHGLAELPVVANDVEIDESGHWRMVFKNAVPNGIDKVEQVRLHQNASGRVVYFGDSHSDFEAALAADLRYAKTGLGLERFLQNRSVPYMAFSQFSEIDPSQFLVGPAIRPQPA